MNDILCDKGYIYKWGGTKSSLPTNELMVSQWHAIAMGNSMQTLLDAGRIGFKPSLKVSPSWQALSIPGGDRVTSYFAYRPMTQYFPHLQNLSNTETKWKQNLNEKYRISVSQSFTSNITKILKLFHRESFNSSHSIFKYKTSLRLLVPPDKIKLQNQR